jgi:hypothetical protein
VQGLLTFVLITFGFADRIILLVVLFVLAILCVGCVCFLLVFVFFLRFQNNEFVMDKLIQAARREWAPCSVDKAVDTISDVMSVNLCIGQRHCDHSLDSLWLGRHDRATMIVDHGHLIDAL